MRNKFSHNGQNSYHLEWGEQSKTRHGAERLYKYIGFIEEILDNRISKGRDVQSQPLL